MGGLWGWGHWGSGVVGRRRVTQEETEQQQQHHQYHHHLHKHHHHCHRNHHRKVTVQRIDRWVLVHCTCSFHLRGSHLSYFSRITATLSLSNDVESCNQKHHNHYVNFALERLTDKKAVITRAFRRYNHMQYQ